MSSKAKCSIIRETSHYLIDEFSFCLGVGAPNMTAHTYTVARHGIRVTVGRCSSTIRSSLGILVNRSSNVTNRIKSSVLRSLC